jgi:hypothetical protein
MSEQTEFTRENEFGLHELLDRTHCIILMLDAMIEKHDFGEHQVFSQHISKAMEALGDLYQVIGGYRFSPEVSGDD